MAGSSEVGDSGRSDHQKSAFLQTCSLLGKFLKEKRSIPEFNGLNLNEAIRNQTTTMELFPYNSKVGSMDSMSLFPQQSGFSSYASVENTPPFKPKPGVSKPAGGSVGGVSEQKSAQMTIFYNGQVIVFNDLSAEKAREVMNLASTFGPKPKNGGSEPTPSHLGPQANPSAVPSFNNKGMQRPGVPNANNFPIARKASLHRFLEKRKDRLVSKCPYSAENTNAGSSKTIDNKSWLGLAATPSFQFGQQF